MPLSASPSSARAAAAAAISVSSSPRATRGKNTGVSAVARTLFAPLGPTYERYAALLSFGQDPRWRRFLVSRVAVPPGGVVLDVATGTGAVAAELLRAHDCRVVGIDQSPEMLTEARRRF